MSYTAHTWVNNETITAAKLNNIEEGIQEAAQSGGGGGGGLTIVPVTYDSSETSFVLSMTAQQIKSGMVSGNLYGINITSEIIPEGFSFPPVTTLIYSVVDQDGHINIGNDSGWSWGCSTLSDYPTCYIGD